MNIEDIQLGKWYTCRNVREHSVEILGDAGEKWLVRRRCWYEGQASHKPKLIDKAAITKSLNGMFDLEREDLGEFVIQAVAVETGRSPKVVYCNSDGHWVYARDIVAETTPPVPVKRKWWQIWK